MTFDFPVRVASPRVGADASPLKSPDPFGSSSWGKPPDAHRFATAALSPLASPLLPKGEASAKGEDRTADAPTSLQALAQPL
ncbi:hypothetical protein [Nostoc sp.]|uniref:hypothetical protein n=1 Tax=Nostoc sp. TaxID=1180 RepID=UPI002FF77F89